jgi:predicted phosphoadenosine phosphosulfate sulfurtransferase
MKQKINQYLTKWNSVYKDGIPDESPTRLEDLGKAPSYRLICKTILKNDFQCETLGFAKNKPLVYHEFKKIELSKRGIYNQLELFK